MADQKKVSSSVSSKEKDSLLADLDIGNDFISSWKAMSMADWDGMDFDLKPGNKKSFNFDKVDIDFNLDGDLGKMSSFNMDMLDLDISPPLKKDGQLKERPKESSGGKDKDKTDQFSFVSLRNSGASFGLEVNKTAAQSSGNPTTLATNSTSKNVPPMQREERGMALKIYREVHNADGLENGKRATTQNEDKEKSESVPEQRETSTKALDTLRLDNFECQDVEGSEYMKKIGTVAIHEVASGNENRHSTTASWELPEVGKSESSLSTVQIEYCTGNDTAQSDDGNLYEAEVARDRDMSVSLTTIVSYIKNNKIFVVADGAATNPMDQVTHGNRQKIYIIDGKYAVTISGINSFGHMFVRHLDKYARKEEYTFRELCDLMELHIIEFCERHKMEFYPAEVIVMGYDEFTATPIIDRVIKSRKSFRAKNENDGDFVAQGCGSKHANEMFDTLKAKDYFFDASNEKIFKGLRACVLSACVKSEWSGGWLSYALLKDGLAMMRFSDHVINLLHDHFDLIQENQVFVGAALLLSRSTAGTDIEQHRKEWKQLDDVGDLIMLGGRYDIGVVVFIVYPKIGKSLNLTRIGNVAVFPDNTLVTVSKRNLGLLARTGYFNQRGVGI